MFRVLILAFGALFWAGQAWAACGAIEAVTQADALVVSFLDARTSTATHLPADEGRLVYDPAAKALKICDGDKWVTLTWAEVHMNNSVVSVTQGGGGGGVGLQFSFVGEATAGNMPMILWENLGNPAITRKHYIRQAYNSLEFLSADSGAGSWVNSIRALVIGGQGNVGIGVDGPTAKLEVEGNIRTRHAAGHRYFELASVESLAGQSCDVSCGVKYCLGAYVDDASHTKVGCGVSTPNRNCICIGR